MLKKLLTPPALATTEHTLEGDLALPSDTGHPMRLGLWALGIGFGGFLLWASFAPLDEGVPTAGMVVIDTKRKAVQHQVGGLIKEVAVHEGQFIKQGDPLVRLNDAVVQAQYESVRQNYLTLRGNESRLVAEQAGLPKIEFHPDLIKEKHDLDVQKIIQNQGELFISRRKAQTADLQAYREAILGQEAALQGYLDVLKSRKDQLDYLQQELAGMRDLVKEGYAPRNKQFELERMVADALGNIAEVQANLQRTRGGIAEQKMRALQRQQEYRKEVDTQQAEVRRQVQAEAERYKAVTQELERTVIRAPAEGQVVGLAVQTVGGVIGPGQKIMDIVPENEMLLIETRVAPNLIDSVKPGAVADVRFASFAHTPQLVVDGKILSISSDIIVEQNMPPYYLARLAITPEGMKILGKRQLQPGMPAEVIIKTGQRSMLTYLLHPLIKRISASMKEE